MLNSVSKQGFFVVVFFYYFAAKCIFFNNKVYSFRCCRAHDVFCSAQGWNVIARGDRLLYRLGNLGKFSKFGKIFAPQIGLDIPQSVFLETHLCFMIYL